MKTKEDITLAFWKIYAEKKIEKISVRELCQKAGYNRSTFYSYYKDIYDLFDKETDKMISLVKEEFHKINDITNLLQNNFIEQVFLIF